MSAENTYETSSNLNDVLRVLMASKKERTYSLKITPGVRKAFTDSIAHFLDAVGDYTIDGDSPLYGMKAMLGTSPKKAIPELMHLLKNRSEVAAKLVDKRGSKATPRIADNLLAAAVFHVAMMRMSLTDRGAFVLTHLPQAVYRAGGSAASATVLRYLRKYVPWKEVMKTRKSRGVTTAASTVTADLILFDAFKRGGPTDLVFDEIKSDPFDLWHKLSAKKMLSVLTAQPKDSVPAIERSKQLVDFVDKALTAIIPCTIYVRSMYDDSKRLADVFAETKTKGLPALRKMLDRASQMNYRAQLEYTDSIDNIMDTSAQYITRAWGAFKTCLYLSIVTSTKDDEERASFLNKAVDLIIYHNLITPERLALMLCASFPYRAVEKMLQHRL